MSEIFNENLREDCRTHLQDLYKEIKDSHEGEKRILTKQQFDNLSNKTSLTNKEMESVVKYANSHEDQLTLNIKTLTDEQSKILGKYMGSWLNLDSLSSITDVQASNLSEFTGSHLTFEGLHNITDVQASNLSNFKGKVLNIGIKKITDNQLKALSHFGGNALNLSGLKNITDKQAEILSNFGGYAIELDGLKNITDKQAEVLSKNRMILSLKGLEKISDIQFNIIMNNVKSPEINVKILNERQINYLRTHDKGIYID